MPLPFRQKLVVGFGGILLMLAFLGAMSYFTITQLDKSEQWVDHSYQVITQVQKIDSDLRNVQAGYRGFLLSQNPYYLRTAQASMNLMLQDAETAQWTTMDNPVQAKNFQELMTVLRERASKFQDRLKLCQEGKIAQATALFRDPQNIQRNDQLNKLLERIILVEQNLLDQRLKNEGTSSAMALGSILLGGIVASAFAFWAWFVISREILEKNRIQDRLEASRRRYRTLIEAAKDAILITNREGRIVESNPAAEVLFDRSQPDLAGEDLASLLPQLTVANGETLSFENLTEIAHTRGTLELQGRKKDGSFFPAEFSLSSIDIEGQVSYVAILRDIGERKKFLETIQRNENRLFQFLEAIPLGIFILNSSGKPYYANKEAKNLLGRGLVTSAGPGNLSETYQSFIAGTDQPYPDEKTPVVRALKGEKSSISDMEVHRPDGSVVPLEVWGTPVFYPSGDVHYAIAVFSDITERKHVEEMKQSLLSIVSHQLKTPVGEINGYIENLLDGLAGDLTAKQRDYLMDMREIGMDNFRLISDLLNLSRLERGIIYMNVDRASLKQVVFMALRDYERPILRKGLTLTLNGLPDDLEVMIDSDKMIETLRNLINNAIKFTDKGGITIGSETQEKTVLLKVKDTGQGMSDAAMKQLFSQKRVLGAEASRAGAGLGLYIAKNFMKLQGGDITVESEPGKGSCFTLTFPRAL